MRIGVVFNCQHRNIANAFRCLRPSDQVSSMELSAVPRERRDAAAAALRGFDLVVTVPIDASFGPLANDVLRYQVAKLVILPPIGFTGFHPDTIYVRAPGGALLDSAIGPYHSRIVVAAFLAFMSVEETVGLFNALTYRKLGYFEEFARASEYLVTAYEPLGVDLRQALTKWRAHGRFMHSINHPLPIVTNEIAIISCRLANVDVDIELSGLEMVPDMLEIHAQMPVYPELAEHLGVPGSLRFKRTHGPFGQNFALLDVKDFVRESLALYRNFPRGSLLAADGVADAITALGLSA